MMPHILFLGGEDHHLRIPFMLALLNRGYHVTAVGSGSPAPFVKNGIDFRPFHFNRFVSPRADWESLQALPRLLEEVRPDIAQSFDLKPNLLLPFAARRVPGIRAIRTINGLNYIFSARTPLTLAARPVYRFLHRRAASSTAATIFQNHDDHAFFKWHGMLGKGRALVIPGSGVDIRGFERAAAAGLSTQDLRDAFGLGNAPVIMTVTRMTRHKGIPTLLKTASLVHAVRPDVRFLLVGPRESEGPLAVSQEEIEKHQPYVMALGPRQDIPSLLRMADLFVYPTEFREGIPRALMEAAATKLPIVATDMPGCHDVIRDGWNGFLVPPQTPQALADRILRLLDDRDLARSMGNRAAETVRQGFSLDHIITCHTMLYDELLGTSNAGNGEKRAAYLRRTQGR